VLKGKTKVIDSRAIIDPSARLADDVEVGPWSIIGANVTIGEGTRVGSNVVIRSNTRIGKGNRIYQFASVGEDPADKKFDGEDTWLEMGDNNIIREGCTLHRGTGAGGGYTRIGNNNLFMAYVHIAHDCVVGDNTVFANNAGLSGHVVVDDWVILGGFAGVNQFLRIGAHAMIGGMTHITNDVPAFLIAAGNPASVRSVNAIGMERRGFTADDVRNVRQAFKMVYRKGLTLNEAMSELEPLAGSSDPVRHFVESIKASTRGIQR